MLSTEEKRLLRNIIITCSNKLFTYFWTSPISQTSEGGATLTNCKNFRAKEFS